MNWTNKDYSDEEFDAIQEEKQSMQQEIHFTIYHYGFIEIGLRYRNEYGSVVVKRNLCDSKHPLANIALAELWFQNAINGDFDLCEEWNTTNYESKEPYKVFSFGLEEGDADCVLEINRMARTCGIRSAFVLGQRLLMSIIDEKYLAEIPQHSSIELPLEDQCSAN